MITKDFALICTKNGSRNPLLFLPPSVKHQNILGFKVAVSPQYYYHEPVIDRMSFFVNIKNKDLILQIKTIDEQTLDELLDDFLEKFFDDFYKRIMSIPDDAIYRTALSTAITMEGNVSTFFDSDGYEWFLIDWGKILSYASSIFESIDYNEHIAHLIYRILSRYSVSSFPVWDKVNDVYGSVKKTKSYCHFKNIVFDVIDSLTELNVFDFYKDVEKFLRGLQ